MTTRSQATALINSNITTNGIGAITGAVLNTDLLSIISASTGYQGVWSSAVSYLANDMVVSASSGGLLYIALADNTNQALSNVTYWQLLTNASGVTSVTAGTGLSGGTITGTGTIALANTAVTAAAYGSSTAIPNFTVNGQGAVDCCWKLGCGGSGGDFDGQLACQQRDWKQFDKCGDHCHGCLAGHCRGHWLRRHRGGNGFSCV